MLDAFERRRQVTQTFLGRVSIDPYDRNGFENYANLKNGGYGVKIFLDDVEQKAWLIADPNEGSVTRPKMHKGQVVVGVNSFEIVKGRVCIKLEPKAKSCS